MTSRTRVGREDQNIDSRVKPAHERVKNARSLLYLLIRRQVGHLPLSRLGFWRKDTSHLDGDRATETAPVDPYLSGFHVSELYDRFLIDAPTPALVS
ncbi:hypothetical protein K0M31_008679 [Melipona bicolor]|uniref:Uncharacterized protein n=1 Tax=Melipona bicolor TaxID=60889 RepID=A0AA40KJX0_9HYME|nr:hypothetical protein K0M31_008679 [Melipona bicolor]